jgi:hypothetical protein
MVQGERAGGNLKGKIYNDRKFESFKNNERIKTSALLSTSILFIKAPNSPHIVI